MPQKTTANHRTDTISVRCEPGLKAKVEELAIRNRQDITGIVLSALDRYIETHEANPRAES